MAERGFIVDAAGRFKPISNGLGASRAFILDPEQAIYSRLEPRYNRVDGLTGDTPIGTSYLGTNVYANLVFQPTAYLSENGVRVQVPGLRIDTVLLEVNQVKTIVKTAMQGRSGTIKQYINNGDFEVMIRGKIVNSTGTGYPAQEVRVLERICRAPVAVNVEAEFLNDVFGVYKIVIERYNFPQTEGMRQSQEFSINAVSDEDIALRLKEDA